MKSLRKNRKKFLPFVEDWTDAQDHLRFKKNINSLSYAEWFWCHPSAYKLIFYGSSIFSICIMMFVSAYFLFRSKSFLFLLFGFMSLASVYRLINKLKFRKVNKHKTFYDQYLRDDEMIEVNKIE